MFKLLKEKLTLLYVEGVKDHLSTVWGYKFILFATKEEGMCPRGFGFIVHKSSDFLFTTQDEKVIGYELVILFRPFPPLVLSWIPKCQK